MLKLKWKLKPHLVNGMNHKIPCHTFLFVVCLSKIEFFSKFDEQTNTYTHTATEHSNVDWCSLLKSKRWFCVCFGQYVFRQAFNERNLFPTFLSTKHFHLRQRTKPVMACIHFDVFLTSIISIVVCHALKASWNLKMTNIRLHSSDRWTEMAEWKIEKFETKKENEKFSVTIRKSNRFVCYLSSFYFQWNFQFLRWHLIQRFRQ